MSSTIYKAVCARLLQVDFTERINVCCLCLETLDDSGVSVTDEVLLQIPNHPHPEATTVAHIINFIMDQSICDIMFLLKSVCKKCMEAAINCFKFIQCCKDNTKIVSAILDNLEESCDKIPQDKIHNYNSIYIAVETNENEKENCLVKRYYDKNRLLVPQDTAFMRFKQITENTIENHKDMSKEKIDTQNQFNALDESLQEIMCCKKYVPTKELLHDPDKPSKLKCRVCLKSFTYITSLRIHFFKVHRNSEVKCKKCSPPKKHRVFLKSPMLKNKKNYKNDESDGDNWQDEEDSLLHRYHEDVILDESQDTDTSNKETILGTFKDVPDFVTTAQEGTKLHRIYSCKKCKQKFKSRACYITHITTNQYQCKRPPKGFGEFICDHCGYTTFYKYLLSKHMTLKHLEHKRYICEFCGRNCYSQSDLTSHTLIHTKEKQLSCELCETRCISKSGLDIHMRIHTGEKPYSCSKCSKRFRRSGELSEHFQRVHNPVFCYKCKLCGKLFKNKKDKERHEVRHLRPNSQVNKKRKPYTGEKKHPCPKCSKSFRRSSDLSEHVKRIHNPIFSYKCKFCDSVFKTKSDKDKHEVRHSQPNSYVNKKLQNKKFQQ